jgi:hypothetical protein
VLLEVPSPAVLRRLPAEAALSQVGATVPTGWSQMTDGSAPIPGRLAASWAHRGPWTAVVDGPGAAPAGVTVGSGIRSGPG